MSGAKRVGVAALAVLLLLLGYAAVLRSCADLDSGSATLYLPQGGSSYRDLQTAEQRTAAPVSFALWRQQPGQTVTTTALGRSSRVELLTLYGDSAIPLPTLPLLPPDSNSCLLDTDSCYQLFGDQSPLGVLVTVGERDYVITGTFDYPQPMLVLRGAPEGGSDCDRVSLALADTPNPAQAAEDFALRHGLSPYATLSDRTWGGWADVLQQLLPMLLLVLLLWHSLRLVAACRVTPVLAALLACGTVVAAVLFWQLCGLGISLSSTSLPSRWSDFSFWSTALAGIRQQLWLLLTLPKELPQAIALAALLRGTLWCVAVLLLLRWVVRLPLQGVRVLFWLTAGCFCAAFAAAVTLKVSTPALWLMLPLYLGWRQLLVWLQTKTDR